MTSISFQIANLLEKMTSNDKDFRFMATNDLMCELQKDNIKLDDDSERKIVKMLLKLLEDKNGEVQNLAVKCLGPLVNKVKEYQVETIAESLCNNMVSEKEQLRDISSIGLKTVISELPMTSSNLAAAVSKKITGRLIMAISEQEDVSVQLEALDIIGDLLSRFSPLLVSFHPALIESLLLQLSSPRQAVRKRTITALANLIPTCSNVLYTKLLDHLLEQLKKNNGPSSSKTYIQCIAAICRRAGLRFSEHFDQVVPLVISFSKQEDEELRENCLQAFQVFFQLCPKEITPYVSTIVSLCLVYIKYDPNYNYEEDYCDEDNPDAMDADDIENGEDDEYSDDDDMSWKVRRAAAKCLEAAISTRHELLAEFYATVSPAIINCFKEREENVKSDIFHAYIALLRQTKLGAATGIAYDFDSMDYSDNVILLLQQQVPSMVKALHIQLRERSSKTLQGCLLLLSELVAVLPGALSNHIAALIPGLQFCLSDKASSGNLKIDALHFLGCLMSSHPPEIFHPFLSVIVPLVSTAVGESFYKISSEALLVTQELVKVINPFGSSPPSDYGVYIPVIYQSTLIKLKSSDIDQEVKERAISAMGQILCNVGDQLQNELPVCLPILLDRLRNEITRLTVVKALTKVAGSPLHVNLQPILADTIPVLASFLRKNQRALKLSTLTLLDTLMRHYQNLITVPLTLKILAELSPLISESDLHISQLTLVLLTSVAKLQREALLQIPNSLLPEVLSLVRSPLLQGGVLTSLLDFLQALVSANLSGLGHREILDSLMGLVTKPNPTDPPSHKQAYHSVAKCVGAITIGVPAEAISVTQQLHNGIQNPLSDSHLVFSLLAIGEIGHHFELGAIPGLQQSVLSALSSSSEEIKMAASFALGGIAVGNLSQQLPFLLNEIENQPKRQYLLLHSLKEVISWQSSSEKGIQELQPFVEKTWLQLLKYCECAEEGARNIVAECLGRLTLIDPVNLLPRLQEGLKSPSALMRTTVVTALKFTISDQPQPVDSLLRSSFGDFLRSLEDPDTNVRRVALVTLNSVAHNKPILIRDILDSILPLLYRETQTRQELIREVEMGPFKHTVDDGLDVRKAAFECMYTLLESCLDRLDVFEFLNHVESGLKDHYDIKMLTYLMVARLAQLVPNAVLQRLERLVEHLRATVMMKVKANSVKQEFEKQDELKRNAMRSVAVLLAIPEAEKNPQLVDFMMQIKSNSELQALFDSIRKDCSSGSIQDLGSAATNNAGAVIVMDIN